MGLRPTKIEIFNIRTEMLSMVPYIILSIDSFVFSQREMSKAGVLCKRQKLENQSE